MSKQDMPKILFLDIETAPMEVYVWGLKYNDYIAVNQIKKDWFMMSWAAKFRGKSKVYQADQGKAGKMSNDRKITKSIWKLLNETDIIVTQNGKNFDEPRLMERFMIHGLGKPKTYRHIDICQLFKSHFKFPSNSLEYLSKKLCTKYKKLQHKNFPGQELWTQCLKGNQKAWKEMRRYNIHDVLCLEELFELVMPYANPINFQVYYRNPNNAKCQCGSTEFNQNGHIYTQTGKFKRYACKRCRNELKSTGNLVKTKFRKVSK